jgi:DNA-binding transcriptional MerR regulator
MTRKRAGGRTKKVHHLTAASLTAGSREFGVATLTVGGIAEQLRALAPDEEASIERIRHWTREGLIGPVKKPNAGAGKHREYDVLSVLDAAILTVIADAGLHIASHKYLLDGLALIRRALQKRKPEKSRDLYLEIAYVKDSDPIFAIHESSVKPNPNARLSILLNLTEIFLDVTQAKGRALGQKG